MTDARAWIRDRALTLVLMVMFVVFLVAQMLTGHAEYNETRKEHHEAPVALADYLATGHPWEALFENWELVHAISPDLTLYGIALAYANHHIKHGT